MEIYVAEVRSLLERENRNLSTTQDTFAKLAGALNMDGLALRGAAYDKMRRYCSGGLMPLAQRVADAANDTIACNNTYISKLDQHFPGMNFVRLEDIQEQYAKVRAAQTALKAFLDNPIVNAVTEIAHAFGIPHILENVVSHMGNAAEELAHQIHEFEAFLSETASLYDQALGTLSDANSLLGAADAAWNATDGYNVAALQALPGGYDPNKLSLGVNTFSGGDVYTLYYVAADGTVGSVCDYNDYDGGQVSCTYYTLRRLHERGLELPFATAISVDGGGYLSPGVTTLDDEHLRQGENGVAELVELHDGGPLHNVVLTFGGPPDTGHVLLIDEVRLANPDGPIDDDHIIVTFSDIYSCVSYSHLTGDHAGYNPTDEMTLAEFKRYYAGTNGPITAAAVLGGSTDPINR